MIKLKGEHFKTKNIVQVLEGLQLSGLMPTIHYIYYWDNIREESCPSVEFTCRDGSQCNVALTRRHISESDQSEDSSMATEPERKTVRKRAAPRRLIVDDNEETGNVVSFMCNLCFFDVSSSAIHGSRLWPSRSTVLQFSSKSDQSHLYLLEFLMMLISLCRCV